jgi:hypothetical protein
MKTLILLVSSFCLGLVLRADDDPSLLKSQDRIAICGDGTADPAFSAYIETYLQMSSPIRGVYLQDFSWSAPTAAGFLARLNTDLLPYKPNVVLTQFGLGEAGDKPMDDATSAAYRQAQTDLVEALKKSGVRQIVVGSPRCVDSSIYHNDPAKAAVANQARSAQADIDKDVAAKEGVVYADVFGSTLAAMTKAKALYGDKYVFENGQASSPSNLVVAYAFLKALGCSGDVGWVTVNDLGGNIQCSPGQWLNYGNNTLTIETSLFPFYYSRWGAPVPDIRKCFPFDDELNRYILTVKNVHCAHVKVTWGYESHDFSAQDLAAGINLPKEFSNTPFSSLFNIVTHSVYDRQQQERASGQASLAHPDDQAATAPWDTLVQNTVANLIYVAKHAQRHLLSIQPLADPEPQPSGPIPVIVDTDMDSDIDDVAALALLNDFMDQGECTILACLHDTTDGKDLSSCATIEAINTYYGHPSIPIGQAYAENDPSVHRTSILAPPPADGYHTVPGSGSGYTLKVHQRFDPTFPNDDKMPPAVDVYRKALASAADGSVVVCSIGNMQNVQDLLLSQPDSVSPLNGVDLVRKKVREVVIMFNTTPQDRFLLSQWPVKVVWSIDIGNYISLGKSLLTTPENNPVRVIFNGNTRQGWDPTAAWLAVRGTGDVYDLLPGRPEFLNQETHPNDTTATAKLPADQVLKLYEDELARPPKP